MKKEKLPWWFWFVMAFVVITGLICIAKHKEEVDKEKRKEAEYDYFWIDDNQCLHKTDCMSLRYGAFDDENDVSHRVQFIRKEELYKLYKKVWKWYCPSCIDVEAFKKIQEIIASSRAGKTTRELLEDLGLEQKEEY
ncbi:MAG: hypothetical protein J5732_05745 [Bacteroidaceae bacterium]|nr:hypothetical protein [Bacteroidaceae bacterium]